MKTISSLLNKYFTGIAQTVLNDSISSPTATCNELTQQHPVQSCGKTFKFKPITNEQAYKALNSLDGKNGTGADGIPVTAIKIAARFIAPSVAYLCNESFRLGSFPSSWKTACVVPLFKGGNPSVRDNHRLAISILPCLSKSHEGFANTQLREYADQTNLISMNQFACRKNSSCLVALLLF